jgi:hypothetical protein
MSRLVFKYMISVETFGNKGDLTTPRYSINLCFRFRSISGRRATIDRFRSKCVSRNDIVKRSLPWC